VKPKILLFAAALIVLTLSCRNSERSERVEAGNALLGFANRMHARDLDGARAFLSNRLIEECDTERVLNYLYAVEFDVTVGGIHPTVNGVSDVMVDGDYASGRIDLAWPAGMGAQTSPRVLIKETGDWKLTGDLLRERLPEEPSEGFMREFCSL
jgi:hypothetical protein